MENILYTKKKMVVFLTWVSSVQPSPIAPWFTTLTMVVWLLHEQHHNNMKISVAMEVDMYFILCYFIPSWMKKQNAYQKWYLSSILWS